ncbi:MAG: signal peptidase I [Bacteroidetes bacterium]|nr:signal peptidase I [Bacteroidota bacterium]
MDQDLNIKNQKTTKDSAWELVRFILVAIIVVLPIRILIAQPFIVSGSSMFPTFKDNQYLIVDQVSYKFENPKRGDVIVFRYPLDTSKFFIKRIIGLPNERVTIEQGHVSITNAKGEEEELDEPYIESMSQDSMSIQLKGDEYFVLGDNRTASSDSRVWGVLPHDNIVGKALIRLLPIDSFDVHPGEYRFDEQNKK